MRKQQHLILFYNQLATLLAGNIPFHEALATIAVEGEPGKVRKTILFIDRKLKGGSELVTTLREHPDIFPDFLLSLVKKQSTGKPLGELFSTLAHDLEKSGKLRKRLINSLIYPGVILMIALFLFFLMLTFVVPIYREMYDGFGFALPAPTAALLAVGTFLEKFWIFLLPLFAGIVLLIFFKPELTMRIGGKIPGFKKLVIAMSLSSFCRSLSILCHFDLSTKEIVVHAAQPVVSVSFRQQIINIASQAGKHDELSTTLAKSTILPSLVKQMVRVGEKSSSLSESLATLATYYENEAERLNRRVILVVDILAILLVAVLVSSFVFALYMPLFHMASVVG